MTNVVALKNDIEPASVPEAPPAFNFSELVAELQLAAAQAAFSIEALNLYALRSDAGLQTIADVKRQIAAFYDTSVLLRTLAPHEDFIRQIAARAEAQA